MDRLSSTPSPDEQMRIDANIFSQSAEGQRMLLRNTDLNDGIDFSKLERPQVKELQALCKIQEDNANELRQLREEISKERNENTLLNKKLAKYDSIKWWLMAGLTLFAGALGWILSQIFG